jgi:excisionase family DNA binding protein
MATVPQAAQILGVDKTTIYRWLRDGFLTGEQLTPGAPWQIRITRALRGKIRPDVPDGWLPLDQAAKVLGVARQTVLHKVQRGELDAAHVTSGRRKGLRIQVERDQPGLFDTSHGTKGAVLTMADLTGDDADGAFADAPGDAGDGFVVGGVPVQHAGCQITAEGHPAEPVMGLQLLNHRGLLAGHEGRQGCGRDARGG